MSSLSGQELEDVTFKYYAHIREKFALMTEKIKKEVQEKYEPKDLFLILDNIILNLMRIHLAVMIECIIDKKYIKEFKCDYMEKLETLLNSI